MTEYAKGQRSLTINYCRGDKTVFNGRTDNIVINSNPAIISFRSVK